MLELAPETEKRAEMCDFGPCTERWSVVVDLAGKDCKFVCAAHVCAVVRENVEPVFEAMGVPEWPKTPEHERPHLEVVR